MTEPHLTHVVWETTRRCDQTCLHCVNASGKAAPGELNEDEAEDLCEQIIALGVQEVGLTGGESYLRRDIYGMIARLRSEGITVRMQTGGFTLTPKRAARLKEAGLSSLGVSIDGTEAVHDLQRGRPGSFAAALKAIDTARDAGLPVGVNTQLNRLTRPHLAELAGILRDHGVLGWQVFLTLPEGRASAHRGWILQPYEIPDLLAELAALQVDAWERPRPHEEAIRFNINPGSNLGYFGPHELTLRSALGQSQYWGGPLDGIRLAFIGCDGVVKGATFLQGARHRMGNLRERSLREIWEDPAAGAYTRRRDVADLWGHCRGCYYEDVCYGGDILTAEALLGRRGNNPLCAHRALTLAKAGRRERLVPREAGDPGAGAFTLVEEDIPAIERSA